MRGVACGARSPPEADGGDFGPNGARRPSPRGSQRGVQALGQARLPPQAGGRVSGEAARTAAQAGERVEASFDFGPSGDAERQGRVG